ncbi:YggS family pyridoxal phosphate-dependent enzyme [Desulfocurvibacter africanus]|uniref:YggS family pyridoxal phosphate-dependent enzyme n=1 Tax=Desulfocurvibacter africanus TaxID=873 RepID=UPI002FD9A2F3
MAPPVSAERSLELRRNLEAVLAGVNEAAVACGRTSGEVTLVAVSKFHPAQDVRALAGFGQMDFGESYVQEALAKREELQDLDLRWHFIGRLQTNKARHVAGSFSLVHSVDSLKLAQTLHKRAQALQTVQEVLLQVNLAGEGQKAGAAADEARRLAQEVRGLDSLALRGLMLLPPLVDEPEQARPWFAALRELRDSLERELGVRLPHLSMGMTGDFRQAIAEGATIVRIGTRIFGERAY